MARRTTAFDLTLPLPDGHRPGYRWLYEALRGEILDGRLRPGTRLPSTRDIAARYGLSRGTIVTAFEQLKAEGYLDGAAGSGTFVSNVLPEALLHVRAPKGGRSKAAIPPHRTFSAYARRLTLLPNLQVRPSRAFRPNVPALELFPMDVWTQTTTRCLRYGTGDLLLGCDAMGYRPLRTALADYLNSSRGVKCTADQIAIVFGVQDALDIVSRLFLDPGDRVCMEDPGYDGARVAFSSVGVKIATAGIDDEGMRVPSPSNREARLAYVTPGHQFPTGVTMSLRRRLQLLEWARSTGALIFEDDYDSEFRYSGAPVPAMQGLDRDGVVLYAGTFGKVLFPSIRLGYLVVPADLVPRIEALKSVSSRHAPLMDQVVLTRFIEDGHFARHLRRMREVYANRLAVLLDCSNRKLSGALDISTVEAGLQTAAWLRGNISGLAVERAAAERDVEVTALSRFHAAPFKREGLQLGFAAVNENEIRRGVDELATALDSLTSR